MEYFAHSTAVIDRGAYIGKNTRIWHFSHVSSKVRIGKKCNIGQSVFIDNNTTIGNYCKIQNNVNIYEGVVLEDFVFCGPSMTFTNVKIPRARYPRERGGCYYLKTLVKEGASIGAHVTIVCGVTIGKNALIGSGAVVTKDVPNHAIIVGNPGKQIGWACECGKRLYKTEDVFHCSDCEKKYKENTVGLEELK
ncbi:N-acetyltransferase [Clostridiales bacterium BAD-6]|uniref:N-acetyltransferase n=2 Tax=Sinanaerobacter chloroacetimidivorans TaxID=2818044 RepID=A0A8J8B2P2_9FIRM|nr:N-acetyltransferase [Sinanaerobacter chloroacetimidivorans]